MVATAELMPIGAAVVASTPDAIVVIGEDGCVLGLNPAAESLFGYPIGEAKGRALADLIVPEHLREAHLRGFAAYVAGGPAKVIGRPVAVEARHKDGRLFPIELTVLEINVEGRRLFSATIRDRSADAARAEELEQMRRQLELAVEGAQIGIWSYDPRTGISWYSDRVKEIVGMEENFLPDGEAFRQRVHPDDRSQLVFDRTGDFPEGRITKEYRIVRPDGETRWLHSVGAAVRNDEGEVEAIHGVIIDISERKRAEDDLDLMRRRLELAVQGAAIGVWTMDPADGSFWFSDLARDMLALDGNLASARDFKHRVHRDDWDRLMALYQAGFPEGSVGVEYRIVRPDGEVRWVYGLGATECGEDGAPKAIHGILLDIDDRKCSEEQLALVRRRLELAVSGAQLGTWSFDPRKGSLWFSDRSKELLGLPDNHMANGRDLKDHIHPDDWEALAAPYYGEYPDQPLAMEFRAVLPDGGIRWISALGAAERGEQGELEAIHGIHIDVTARKQADAEMELMRRRLELAMNGAKIGIWSFNPETGAVWYSQRSREIYALDPDQPLDTPTLRSRVHPDDWARLSAPYYNGFPEEPVEIEYRVVHPNGETRWVYALGAAVRDEGGAPQAVHGIHIDVTERKAAEDELAETRRQLELAVSGANIGSWTVDPETGVTWYSKRSREIHGLDPDTPLTAKTLKSFIHPDDWGHVLESYRRNFPGDDIVLEHRVVRPDGEVRWVQSLGTARRDSSGKVRLVSGIHIDVTERRTAEAELARSREALVQSEKLAALGSLLAGVSHELNNPLAAIVGQAEMLAEDAAGTAFEARAQRISAAADRSARIVQTFLAMARQRERQVALVDMNDVVASALELTDYALRTAGIAVKVNFGSRLPAVEGDRDQLHQVLVNLIVNAQQAMEKGETFEKVLTIRTSAGPAGRVLIDVSDTGPGVPEDVRCRIFEPFFTTKKQHSGGGTGIGLSFSQGIVAAHGGALTVEPSRRGAHFRIDLPSVAADLLTAVPTEESIVAEPLPTSRRCLVVEDEDDVAATLSELIEREGYEVRVAPNGIDALHQLEREHFDLLVSDLRMPQLNGPELHARLSETHPELVERMAFVTGDTIGDAMGDFARNCGRPVLEKPFTRAGVRALLAALLDQEAKA